MYTYIYIYIYIKLYARLSLVGYTYHRCCQNKTGPMGMHTQISLQVGECCKKSNNKIGASRVLLYSVHQESIREPPKIIIKYT